VFCFPINANELTYTYVCINVYRSIADILPLIKNKVHDYALAHTYYNIYVHSKTHIPIHTKGTEVKIERTQIVVLPEFMFSFSSNCFENCLCMCVCVFGRLLFYLNQGTTLFQFSLKRDSIWNLTRIFLLISNSAFDFCSFQISEMQRLCGEPQRKTINKF